MPRLNLLDKSLSFYGDDIYHCYEEEYEEVYRDDWYDGLGIIDDCNLPFRESIRANAFREGNWWGLWGYQLVGTSNIWQFRDRILEHNLGKSHDLTFSYYCKKAKHVQNYLNIWFEAFHHKYKRFDGYMVDSDGNIQKGPWRLRQEEARFKRSSKLYVFDSADLVTGYRRKSDGELFTESEYSNKFYIELRTEPSGFERVVLQGYQVENVQPNSKQEKRLRNEYIQKHKQLEKQRKAAIKAKSYSFLTKSELEKKEAKKEEIWKIQSHGLREDCFRGKEYHGRKNKNK